MKLVIVFSPQTLILEFQYFSNQVTYTKFDILNY